MIELSRLLSSKYTRSKVRKAMPSAYAYILDELLHALPDEDDNQLVYHQKIIDALIDIGSGDEFIVALCGLIKRLAVDPAAHRRRYLRPWTPRGRGLWTFW